MNIDLCEQIKLPQHSSELGKLTHVEQNNHIPFKIRRVYYTYEVPENVKRGVHAHKALEQVLIAVSGGLQVKVDDGRNAKTVTLNNPNIGLYIPPLIWRELDDFLPNTVLLVLASKPYDDNDYIHSYNQFQKHLLSR